MHLNARSKKLVLRGAVALCLLGALVGAATAVAASRAPAQYSKAVCSAAPVRYARCMSYVVTNEIGQPLAAASAASGFGPGQFQTAYGLTAAAAASTTEVVAIVDAYDNPNAKSDLDTYSSNFGLPVLPVCSGAPAAGCFKKVNQSGGSTMPSGDTGWGLEIALDVETVHAVCPKCGIVLVEANSNFDSDLYTAEDYAAAHANVVSNSWGGGEYPGETTDDAHFNHPGVAITVSSGDSGYGVEYPAASRYVTAVGGTTLNVDGGYNRTSETVWSGSGSGCSAYDGKQAWQTDSGCSKRTVADVSADANPSTGAAVYDTYGYGGWVQVGGTSLSAPLIGAVYALAGVGGTSDYPSSYPYAHASSLFDVTSGSNGSCGSYLCPAQAGYDGPTGLGAPNGVAAFQPGGGGGGGGGGGSAPTVTSFSPTSGQVGTSVTVYGTNFTGVTAVTFNGTAATSYTVNSSTTITATVPTGATSGPIAVSTTAGTGTSGTWFTVTTVAAPRITGFSPSYGRTGTAVLISGSGFTGATSVKLGGTSAGFVVLSSSRIQAVVPALSSGKYKWQVTTPGGTATSSASFRHL